MVRVLEGIRLKCSSKKTTKRQPSRTLRLTVEEIKQKYCLPKITDEKIKKKIKGKKLPKKHYRKVRENFTFLIDKTDGKDLAPFFFEKGVFDFDDMEEVKAEENKKERALIFTKKLLHSGKYGYNVFMHALLKCGDDDVIEKLEKITIELSELDCTR